MCYVSPGPRCTPHARADLATAQTNWENDQSEKNFKALQKAQQLFDSTPGGQKELEEQIKEKKKKRRKATSLELRLEAGKILRANQMSKMMVTNSGLPNARSVRRGMNNPEDPSSAERLESLCVENEVWKESLDGSEDWAVTWYGMHGHESVNAYLREGFDGPAFLEKKAEATRLSDYGGENAYEEMVAERIENLDTAIAKAPKTDEPRVLYRSIRIPRQNDNPQAAIFAQKNFEPGQTVTFPSYLSTSADSDLMLYNATAGKKRHAEDHVVFEILSSQGVSMQPRGKIGSIQSQEREVLLPRGSQMRVAKVIENVSFRSSHPVTDSYRQGGALANFSPYSQHMKVTVVQLVDVTDEPKKQEK